MIWLIILCFLLATILFAYTLPNLLKPTWSRQVLLSYEENKSKLNAELPESNDRLIKQENDQTILTLSSINMDRVNTQNPLILLEKVLLSRSAYLLFKENGNFVPSHPINITIEDLKSNAQVQFESLEALQDDLQNKGVLYQHLYRSYKESSKQKPYYIIGYLLILALFIYVVLKGASL